MIKMSNYDQSVIIFTRYYAKCSVLKLIEFTDEIFRQQQKSSFYLSNVPFLSLERKMNGYESNKIAVENAFFHRCELIINHHPVDS